MKRTRIRPVSAKRAALRDEHALVREQVFARDGHRCRLEGVSGTGRCRGPLTPHHRKKASQGGAYSPENLLSLCAGHNTWVEDEPDLAYALGMVVRRGDPPG